MESASFPDPSLKLLSGISRPGEISLQLKKTLEWLLLATDIAMLLFRIVSTNLGVLKSSRTSLMTTLKKKRKERTPKETKKLKLKTKNLKCRVHSIKLLPCSSQAC
jgi:hypothetical protein